MGRRWHRTWMTSRSWETNDTGQCHVGRRRRMQQAAQRSASFGASNAAEGSRPPAELVISDLPSMENAFVHSGTESHHVRHPRGPRVYQRQGT